MPKKADDSLKTDNELYLSKIEASKKYDSNNVDNVRVRVPKGWNQLMKDYVENNKDKYNSVNAMLIDLIRKELGIEE